MSSQSQSELELVHLAAFQRLFPACPQGAPDSTGGRPDFVFDGPPRIGIEHTQFIAGAGTGQQPPAMRESFEERLATRIGEILRSTDAAPSDVLISLRHGARVDERKLEGVAQVIASAVRIRPVTREFLERLDWRHVPELRDTPIDLIYLRRQGVSHHHCGSAGAAFQTTPDVVTLQERLDEKESKIQAYRESCDDLWLLVVADGSTLSRGVDMEGFPSEHLFKSSFDRAWFLADSCRLVELKLHP